MRVPQFLLVFNSNCDTIKTDDVDSRSSASIPGWLRYESSALSIPLRYPLDHLISLFSTKTNTLLYLLAYQTFPTNCNHYHTSKWQSLAANPFHNEHGSRQVVVARPRHFSKRVFAPLLSPLQSGKRILHPSTNSFLTDGVTGWACYM